ncbi:hypothetical protein [Oceanivirga miroungae]|uniref:Uncharacterized protein n=2 Tax=Oceanivirga miroungae TaxID=1130046 RepID=A0A6I8MCP8_9FUSO|nr:hypothetical protein [Oceanivirga miroungae]VWL85210.1 hypothetical protein OMES3154_00493 [Oceanivirga miroungae]
MSIRVNFTNNIQELIYSNIILNLNNQINSLKDIVMHKTNLIKELEDKVTSIKLSNQIKKLNGTYVEPTDETSRSPVYEYFKVDKEAIKTPIVSTPSLNYKEILANGKFKHSKAYLKPNFPNPDQICPNCSSTKEWHYLHTKTQKRCKLCLKTFIFSESQKIKISDLSDDQNLVFACPYCYKTLSFRVSRSAFDVYCCKNKKCPFRIKAKEEIIKTHGSLKNQDKISYIYRDIKTSINDVFKFIDSSKTDIPKRNFIFRNFNSKIF